MIGGMRKDGYNNITIVRKCVYGFLYSATMIRCASIFLNCDTRDDESK